LFKSTFVMPEYLAPGVYVEETSFRTKRIEGVSTSTAAFVGFTRRGPLAVAKRSKVLTSFSEFERIYGGTGNLIGTFAGTNYVAHAAKAFFAEGGRRLYVGRVKNTSSIESHWAKTLHALLAVEEIAIIAAPGSTELGSVSNALQAQLLAHVETNRSCRFAVLDVPKGLTPNDARAYCAQWQSKSAAIYYSWVQVAAAALPGKPRVHQAMLLPTSGFVCGIYARCDVERGVFKAPANAVVRSATGLEREVTSAEQEMLNPLGVNCIRSFPGRGIRVWGARTLSSDPEWKYVNVRRYFLYLEHSIDKGTQWAVFEPNGETLWQQVRRVIEDFLMNEWRTGALLGSKAEEAFFVRCDRTTMTQNDIDQGRLVCLVGVAAIKPAEFVVLRISQNTAGSNPP
jgi:phage tail sheath protein FI